MSTTGQRPAPRGRVWLLAAGGLGLLVGVATGLARAVAGGVVDAALHTLFLGFVMSMVMGHAPIILPAVLGTSLPFRPSAWLPLGLIHLSVLVRVGADLAGSASLRGWAAHGNVAALLSFVVLAAVAVLGARRTIEVLPPAPERALV